jgi:serine/threonine protein kinase
MEKYKVLGKIGDGTFGKVTKAVNKKTSEVVAIKTMKQKFYNWEECMNLREVKSLRKLQHENIVKLKEVVRMNNDLYFVFEFVEKNLYQVMKENNHKLDVDEAKSVMFQTLTGLAYIHKNGFFHRDIKPENILMENGKVKIADFGLAREIRSKPPYTDYVSTRWYRAPELLLRSTNYSSTVDIFAAGCILAELLLGRPLFAGSSEGDQLMKVCSILGPPSKTEWPEGHKLASKLGYTFPTITKTPLSELLPDEDSELLDLLDKMLIYDPNLRYSAKQCLDHPFFEGFELPKSAHSRNSLFGTKPPPASSNKFISSKLLRMNSKKMEAVHQDRIKSPLFSKTSETDRDNTSANKFHFSKLGGMPGIRSDIGSGFYYKNNKPIKSPGTPSSTNSQSLYTGHKFGTK